MILNEQLATLVCVAEQGSFGKAADKLFISAPAVIKQMNSLGRQTVQENGRSFRIGSSIFKPCQPFIELWNRLNSHFPGYTLQILTFDDDHTGITEIVHSLFCRYKKICENDSRAKRLMNNPAAQSL